MVVDERLSRRKRFATALARHGSQLGDLVHPHIVTTEKVGRGKDGILVLIASAVDAPIELKALMDRVGVLPREIALNVAMGVLRGLSHAHEHEVVHGGVHPRSVLIDAKGITKLGDFGLAHALASAAAYADDSELLIGLRGYVAPELALGQEPDEACDVYAAGALMAWLLWKQQAPPADTSDPLAKVAQTALDTDSTHRFESATTFESALRAAITSGGDRVASASEVCRFVEASEEALDTGLEAETEDVLAALGLVSPPPARSASAVLNDALAELSEEFLGLEDSVDVDPSEITIAKYGSGSGATVYGDEHTSVDPDGLAPTPNPVEGIVHNSKSPPKTVSQPGRGNSRLASRDHYEDDDDDDDDDDDETPLPLPRPFHADGTHTEELAGLVDRQGATASPFRDDEALPVVESQRSNTLRWLVIIALVMAVLGAVAYTKRDRFLASKQESEDTTTRALAQVEKMQPKPGQIVMSSDTEDAAVWLLLGRTPSTSFLVPSSMVHELRIEHEGYRSLFLSVSAQQWSGDKAARKAVLSATLQPALDDAKLLPAFPPVADPPLTPGGAGQGVITVESQPEGAEAWLWIGTTPMANLAGIEVGKEYQLKVLKDGYQPAFAVIKADDWYLSGKAGPTRPVLERHVNLVPLPEEAASEPKAKAPSESRSRSKRRHRRKKRK